MLKYVGIIKNKVCNSIIILFYHLIHSLFILASKISAWIATWSTSLFIWTTTLLGESFCYGSTFYKTRFVDRTGAQKFHVHYFIIFFTYSFKHLCLRFNMAFIVHKFFNLNFLGFRNSNKLGNDVFRKVWKYCKKTNCWKFHFEWKTNERACSKVNFLFFKSINTYFWFVKGVVLYFLWYSHLSLVRLISWTSL